MSTTVNNTTQSNYVNYTETTYVEEERHFTPANKVKGQDNKDTIEKQSNTKGKKFNEAPAKAKDHTEKHPKFKEAPAKAKDHDEQHTKFKEAPAKAKDHDNTTANPPPPPSSNSSSQTNSASDDYSKKSGAELLAAFRNGDEKLLKALNENPALMQKLIDQMHMEERHIELISNYNKSKDDALKTIIHNMK